MATLQNMATHHSYVYRSVVSYYHFIKRSRQGSPAYTPVLFEELFVIETILLGIIWRSLNFKKN